MPARLRLVLLGATVCVAVAATIALFANAAPEPAPEPLQLGPTGLAGAARPQGARVPSLAALRDQDGRPAAAPTGPTIFTFVYATCEDTCPLQVGQIRAALDDLGRDVPVYAVSVDPPRDTPDAARRFLVDQAMTGRMRFLVGTERDLAPVWKAFGIAPQRDGRDHSAYTVLVDGEGRQRAGFPASQLTPEALLHDLEALGA